MKKYVALLLTVLLTLSLFAACAPESSVPVIGISQFGEHPSLDNCREGFLLGLKEAGLEEGKDFVIDYQNAGFNGAATAQIAQSFASKKTALMVGIATPSAQACFNEAAEAGIPTVFVAVTDPVEAKLDSGSVTGVSDQLPVEGQLKLIRALQPEAKTIGVVYSLGEANSVSAIRTYESLAPQYGFTLDAVPINTQAEVTQAVDKLISDKVDCLSNLTDNTVVGVLPAVLDKTNEAGIPVYGSEIEQVKNGCVAGAGIEYVALGKQSGAMAAKILKGEATADKIPYETISEYGLYVNSAVAARLNITLPADVKAQATECGN